MRRQGSETRAQPSSLYLEALRKHQGESDEWAAQMRVNSIAQTEANYTANHADIGYVCTLE